jgi:hypothetical protein
VISSLPVIVLALLFDLSEIAAKGVISMLFVYAVTHIGHLKIISRTGASTMLIILAIFLCLAAMVLALVFEKQAIKLCYLCSTRFPVYFSLY